MIGNLCLSLTHRTPWKPDQMGGKHVSEKYATFIYSIFVELEDTYFFVPKS